MENTATAEKKTTEELLEEILKYQKRGSRITRIAAFAVIFIVVIFAGALALMIPRAVNLLDHARESLAEIDYLIDETGDLITNTNNLVENFNDLSDGTTALIDNANKMISDNTDAITETVQKLNDVDFETLNQAIQDFSAVVEPLSKFFKRF
ncbi:MAG: hypothetical protein IJ796_08325 [Lachnospiraceae bacterium]|nr:hypothetical protein [Lachnospiraceae bacterium]